MTPEDKACAKISGILLAAALLCLMVLFFGPLVIGALKALDDGPAHRPSEFEQRR